MTPAEFFAKLNMIDVCEHYATRANAHAEIRKLFDAGDTDTYANLALGISDPTANYSAAEHRRGPQILRENGADEVYALAQSLNSCKSSHHVPEVIYSHNLSCLKIGVGSEIAMMLRPNDFWVGNRRTIWCHLLVKHGWNASKANQELTLYYDNDDESEMDYPVWRDLYLAEEPNLLAIGQHAAQAAIQQGHVPGTLQFLWPDAVATFLFDQFAAKKTKNRITKR